MVSLPFYKMGILTLASLICNNEMISTEKNAALDTMGSMWWLL